MDVKKPSAQTKQEVATITEADYSIIVSKEGAFYTAWCPEMSIGSQGRTFDEAAANLRKSVNELLKFK